jgi:Fe-Mn family superoxide dismutase
MPFHLPELPFNREALGELMSAETLDFHPGKLQKGYVD